MADYALNNPKLKNQKEVTNCPKCGAPILSEVCQYCGTYIGEVATGDLAAEYPMIKCKCANFTFFGIVFPLIFIIGFSIPALVVVAFDARVAFSILMASIPVTLTFLVIFVVNISAIISNAKYGQVKTGTVYGYMDDVIAYNGVNGQRVKILISTSDGYKFILLPLHTTEKPYAVNSKVKLRVYKNTVKLLDNKLDNPLL